MSDAQVVLGHEPILLDPGQTAVVLEPRLEKADEELLAGPSDGVRVGQGEVESLLRVARSKKVVDLGEDWAAIDELGGRSDKASVGSGDGGRA